MNVFEDLNPLAQGIVRDLLAIYPHWEDSISLRGVDDLEVVVPAPSGSNAGCLAVFTERGKDLWLRYDQPQMCYALDDVVEMLSIIEQLLNDQTLFVRITEDEEWKGTTLIRPGMEPPFEPGQVAQIVSWSSKYDRGVHG